MAIFRGAGGSGDATGNVTITEIQNLRSEAQLAASEAELAQGYAEEWANKAEDSLVSTGAGGDGVDDYSALHWSLKAEDEKIAAELAKTAAELAETNAESAQTAAELAEDGAVIAQTAAELAETGAELAEDGAVAAQVAAELAEDGAVAAQVAAELAEDGAVAAQSAAELAEDGAVAAQSAAELAEDGAALSESNAATSASNALTSENNAATSASNALTSENNAASSADDAADSALEASTYVADQTGNAGKFLQTNGSVVSWEPAVEKTSSTGSAIIPAGTEAQRDGSPVNGYFRYNSDAGQFEGYASGAWGAVGGGVPSGQVSFFAMSSAPSGWLKANGAAISRSTYASLFSAIGTTYGAGDGSTTFNLPDMRGEFPRGWDDARGVDSGRAIGTTQMDSMREHSHRFGTTTNAALGSARNVIRGNNLSITNATTDGTLTHYVSNGNQDFSGVSGGVDQTAFMGSEVRPRNVSLLVCIKY